MAYVAVDQDGTEKISGELKRDEYFNEWMDIKEMSEGEFNYETELPKGTIEKLLGYKLTWKDEPVELR